MRIRWIPWYTLALCIFSSSVSGLRAEWLENGTPICAQASQQTRVRAVSDGEDGAIVAWGDYRNGDLDIFAQRIDNMGNTLWTTNGVPVCTEGNPQYGFEIIPDGEGGAIVAWYDERSGTQDIYAQRINAGGLQLWTLDGIAVCTAVFDQFEPFLAKDGAGGAIIVWTDDRGGGGRWEIYTQRLDATGTALWTADGVKVCTDTSGVKYRPAIAEDTNGGAFVFWSDFRNFDWDIYVQKVNFNGALWWDSAGEPVCTAPGAQEFPTVIPDGFGGVIAAWQDYRSGSNFDIYAQRITQDGLDIWAYNGDSVCTANGDQTALQLVSDGLLGAIITWEDLRNANADVYAQRILASGNQQWGIDGVAITRANNYQRKPFIVSDGVGGAIITWEDYRYGGGYDVFAQRVDGSGAVLWTQDGEVVSFTNGQQLDPRIVSDGAKGAIIAFVDTRGTSWDVYAQRIERNGFWGYPAPDISGIRDVPGDQGGYINLSWDASRLDIDPEDRIEHYSIWRAIEKTAAMAMIESGAQLVTTVPSLIEKGAEESTIYDPTQSTLFEKQPVIRREILGIDVYYWALVDTVESFHYIDTYSMTVPTLFDSTAASFEYHYFQVIAHESDPNGWWVSVVDSGYSIDNLAPDAPQCLAGEQSFAPEGINITWALNEELDFDHYVVYRGMSADFIPGPGNFLASLEETEYFDNDWRWDVGYWYKVAAIDRNGNESCYALLGSDTLTGDTVPLAPLVTCLEQNYPNPFNPTTVIKFDLPSAVYVKLSIYNIKGELVATIVDRHMTEGHKEVSWTANDKRGRAVSSGIYFYRLIAGDYSKTRKMVLLR